MSRNILIMMAVVTFLGCKKEYDVQPTYASLQLANTWAQNQPYYSPHPQIYIDSTGIWKPFISFSFVSASDPSVIGFSNPYVPGKGTDALYMSAMYNNAYYTSRYNVNISADSGTYNTIIPQCFKFIPKSSDSTTTGTVVVLPQVITLTRKDRTKYQVSIAPSTQPGTYNTKTGVFEIEVLFDESNFGGPKEVRRKYKFTS